MSTCVENNGPAATNMFEGQTLIGLGGCGWGQKEWVEEERVPTNTSNAAKLPCSLNANLRRPAFT